MIDIGWDRFSRWNRALVPILVLLCSAGRAAEIPEEFRVKRQAVFEFTRKPTVKRKGDRVAISFASKAYCDVTVAIENSEGRIVRHLASGVLGKKAPAPFKRNSLTQSIVWDGKDDRGRYVDNKDDVVVRVSLGLKPRFERSLLWTPYKRYAKTTPIIKACPQGVLVYEGQIYDSVRLFDHRGDYVRTVYPFPAAKLKGISDLRWKTFPQDGKRLPMKEWFRQATLLTGGDNSNRAGKNAGAGWRGFGSQRWYHDGHGAGAHHHAASMMAVHPKGRIALGMYWLNRLDLTGGIAGLTLNGPELCFLNKRGGLRYLQGEKIIRAAPHSAALSPDGKWVYLTAYNWMANFGTGGRWRYWLPGVTRVAYEAKKDANAEVFIGSIKTSGAGSGNAQFKMPTSVDCDPKGRIYVSDFLNDRVQVFTPGGKHFKTLKTRRPARVIVHRKTGEIYVFSWAVNNVMVKREKVEPRFTRYGPIEKPRRIESCALPLPRRGSGFAVELDSWAPRPTIWIYGGSRAYYTAVGYAGHRGGNYWQAKSFEIFELKGGKLTSVRDFSMEGAKAVRKTNRVVGTGRNLTVNPKTGELYVGDGCATAGFSYSLGVRVNAESGKARLVHLPFDAEQWAFDTNGLAYLRAKAKIVRYDPANWREVPWDYGEEHKDVGVATTMATGPGMKRAPRVISALTTPYFAHAPNGVFGISPRGRIVMPLKAGAGTKHIGNVFRKGQMVLEKSKPYEFKLFPGRSVSGLVMIFDKHGALINDDAVPGLTLTHGIKIDNRGDLYVLAMQNRVLGGKPYHNPATCTLIKFKPGKGRIVGTHKHAVPVPLKAGKMPKRPPDLIGGGKSGLKSAWVSGHEWMYGGVGYTGEHHKNPAYGCDCCYSSFDLDLFARSFAPEVEHCSVAVLDSEGNLVLRIGTYGNVDDGKPLIPAGGPGKTNALGGDEVALFYAPHLAVHTDRRLFVADVGNERIVSVKLGYHASESVKLKDVPDAARR